MEYLADGSPGCPLLRLYDFDVGQACRLHTLLLGLAMGTSSQVSLQEALAVEAVAGCVLVLQTTDTDQGIVWDAQAGVFFCRLTCFSWQNAVDRAMPFCTEGAKGRYQWLDETSSVDWLLSTDGFW